MWSFDITQNESLRKLKETPTAAFFLFAGISHSDEDSRSVVNTY